MAIPVVIPNTFANATASIPLSQLDANFNALANVFVDLNSGAQQLANANVATIVVNSNNISADNSLGFRNRIINGDMRIDQRNAGAAIATGQGFAVDRWQADSTQASKLNIQQNNGSVTPPTGFVNYWGANVATAYTITASDTFYLRQQIEGTNIADLAWGTANAKTVTLSFWVRSSLTGTFGGSLKNSAANRSYPFSYAISAADTWEHKTIVISGDTSGTWLTTNGIGIRIFFSQGTGSTYLGTAGAWAGANYDGATGQVQLVETLNATWYVTGVQLEVGSVATPFERRPYGTELSLCQRYYYKIQAIGSADFFGAGFSTSTTESVYSITLPVEMRTNPSALETSGTASDYRIRISDTNVTCSAVPSFGGATRVTSGVNGTVSSGTTAGQGSLLRANSTNAFLAWSAEL